MGELISTRRRLLALSTGPLISAPALSWTIRVKQAAPRSWIASAPRLSPSAQHIVCYRQQRYTFGSQIPCLYFLWMDSRMQGVLALVPSVPFVVLSALGTFLSPKRSAALFPARLSEMDVPAHS